MDIPDLRTATNARCHFIPFHALPGPPYNQINIYNNLANKTNQTLACLALPKVCAILFTPVLSTLRRFLDGMTSIVGKKGEW